MLKSHFVHTTCHNCDTFRSILIILRELLNTIKHIGESLLLWGGILNASITLRKVVKRFKAQA